MAEKILVISTYPPKGSLYNHPSSAVAGYTKNTLVWANKDGDFSYLVLADIFDKPETYEEDGYEIHRCWQGNTHALYLSLIREVIKRKDYRKILFAFEWAMFGAKKWLLVFVPLLLVLFRLLNRKVYFVSHGVLLNASLVSIQMGVKEKSFKAQFWSFGLKALYLFVVLLSRRVVVFEEYLRQELLKLIKLPSKIVTINHGVSLPDKQNKKKKDKTTFLVQSFGFLIWYKGSDWLVEQMANFFKEQPHTDIRLTMVGGATKTYNDTNYQNFIGQIYDKAENSDGKIKITGFVKEEEIAGYFQTADLLILPYRVLISASGPLSLVFTYKKPFLISEKLQGYSYSADFSEALNESGLTIEDLTFSLEGEDLVEKIRLLKDNPLQLAKIRKFSEIMFEKRSWLIIGEKYRKLLKNEIFY